MISETITDCAEAVMTLRKIARNAEIPSARIGCGFMDRVFRVLRDEFRGWSTELTGLFQRSSTGAAS
jgi:hypothetical protein